MTPAWGTSRQWMSIRKLAIYTEFTSPAALKWGTGGSPDAVRLPALGLLMVAWA